MDTATTPEQIFDVAADGEQASSADPHGDTNANTYDGYNLAQTNQSGHDIAAQYNYDPATGNLASLNLYQSGTVGSGTAETTSFAYDPSSGQMLSTTFADGTSDAFSYNAKQQLTGETLPGETVTNAYNTSGNQTSSSAVDSITGTTVTDTSTYDTNGQLSTITQATGGSTTSSASNTFAYNAQGNLTSESQAGGVTTVYSYFGDGSSVPGAVQSVKLLQNGVTLGETDYAYNASQQLTAVTVNGHTFTVAYQSGTNLVSSIASGKASTGYSYDADTGNLTGVSASGNGASIFSAGYSYNDNNQRTSQTVSQTNSTGGTTSQNWTFGYDNANELASVTNTATSVSLYGYAYDGAGNFTSTSLGTANSLNEYGNLTYNSRGDVTNDGTQTYTWNAADQLIAVTKNDNSVKVTYAYDGEGRRIEKDVYAYEAGTWSLQSTRKFVYDGTDLVEETDGSGNAITGYTWGPQGLMAVTDYTTTTPTVYLAVLDGQGNVVGLANASTGVVAASYTYDPYGALLTHTGPAEAVCNVLYKQGYTDREVGLNYFKARYEMAAGIWISRDPAGIAGGSNLGVYCGNDPINKIDSAGLDPLSVYTPNQRREALAGAALWFNMNVLDQQGQQAAFNNNPEYRKAVYKLLPILPSAGSGTFAAGQYPSMQAPSAANLEYQSKFDPRFFTWLQTGGPVEDLHVQRPQSEIVHDRQIYEANLRVYELYQRDAYLQKTYNGGKLDQIDSWGLLSGAFKWADSFMSPAWDGMGNFNDVVAVGGSLIIAPEPSTVLEGQPGFGYVRGSPTEPIPDWKNESGSIGGNGNEFSLSGSGFEAGRPFTLSAPTEYGPYYHSALPKTVESIMKSKTLIGDVPTTANYSTPDGRPFANAHFGRMPLGTYGVEFFATQPPQISGLFGRFPRWPGDPFTDTVEIPIIMTHANAGDTNPSPIFFEQNIVIGTDWLQDPASKTFSLSLDR